MNLPLPSAQIHVSWMDTPCLLTQISATSRTSNFNGRGQSCSSIPVRNCSRKSREIPRIPKNISQEIPGFLRVNWHKIPGNSQEFLGKEMKNCSSDFLRIPGKSWEFPGNGCMSFKCKTLTKNSQEIPGFLGISDTNEIS